MAKLKTAMAGRWRIKSMTEWDNDFIDAEVPGYINFAKTASAISSLATSAVTSTGGDRA